MEDTFYKIDLHIHTPASKDYRGLKDDEEYFRIIKSAINKDIKIIAFTDHNSIEGYKRLQEIKNSLENEQEAYLKITDSAQTSKKLKSIEKNLELFKKVLILPAVEFEVRNNVHILVIFNPKTKIEVIEKFLIDGGYDQESMGLSDPSEPSNWDILNLYEESKKYDCLVIDAHTDSSKGIWETIQSGTYRAHCFKAEQLLGVCYNNEKQKEHIQRLTKETTEYKRKSPLAFLKFSDAHNYSEVGRL